MFGSESVFETDCVSITRVQIRRMFWF